MNTGNYTRKDTKMMKSIFGSVASIVISLAVTLFYYKSLFDFVTAAERGNVAEMSLISALVFVATGLAIGFSLTIKGIELQFIVSIFLHVAVFIIMALPVFAGYTGVLMNGNPESNAYIWFWFLYVAMGISPAVAIYATPRKWMRN